MYPIEICECCLLAISNAETCDCPPEDHPDKIENEITLGWADADYADNNIDPETEDRDFLGFSWHRCFACHSTLGGDRYAATVWLGED